MYQTEALPHERVEERRIARLRAVAVQFGFAERIVEHSPKADNSLYDNWLRLPKKPP